MFFFFFLNCVQWTSPIVFAHFDPRDRFMAVFCTNVAAFRDLSFSLLVLSTHTRTTHANWLTITHTQDYPDTPLT